jgi:uncharacterized protein (TIGR00369 family)
MSATKPAATRPALAHPLNPPRPGADTVQTILAEWEATAAAVMHDRMHVGVAHLSQVAGKTGMEVFDAMQAGELPYPPIAESLDFLLIEATPGRALFQGSPKLRHYNPLGTVHGGWIATLLDSCVGCAVHTLLPAGKTYTTAELKINYVKALGEKAKLVRAEGQVIHMGGRMATADGRLYGADGTLYAHASTTCFIFDVPASTS